MSAWEEWKKELGVSVNIYEVWRHKGSEELILLMRAWDVYIVVIRLGPKGPINESISILELNKEYNSTSESIGNFLHVATKRYGSAEQTRELILSIERPGLNPTLKELEMAKKTKKTTKTAIVKKSTVANEVTQKEKKAVAAVKVTTKKKTIPAASMNSKNNIGSLVRQLLAKKLSSEEILAKVSTEFPNARTSVASISWYRGKMKAAGELPGD